MDPLLPCFFCHRQYWASGNDDVQATGRSPGRKTQWIILKDPRIDPLCSELCPSLIIHPVYSRCTLSLTQAYKSFSLLAVEYFIKLCITIVNVDPSHWTVHIINILHVCINLILELKTTCEKWLCICLHVHCSIIFCFIQNMYIDSNPTYQLCVNIIGRNFSGRVSQSSAGESTNTS